MQYLYKIFEKVNRTSIFFYIVVWILNLIWIFTQKIPVFPICLFTILTIFAVLYLSCRFFTHEQEQSVAYAYTDPVTQHGNLLKFRSDAETLFRTYPDGRFVLFYSDIQNFKYINDVYGYEKGNQILHHCSHILEQVNGLIFVRIHNDNFVAVQYCNRNTPGQIIDQFMQEIKIASNVSAILPDMVSINISVGAVRIDRNNRSLTLDSMIDRARIAQKSSNFQTFDCTIFQEDFRKTMLREQRMENRMRTALQSGEFVIFLQPKFDIQKNQAVAAEALVRWQDPQYGLISPGEFIPLFEKNGFIRYLDTEVFRQVCILIRKWLNEKKQPLPISVNVSKIQLTDPDFVLKYLAIREEYQIPDGLLEIEFTESVLVEEDNAGEVIEAFREKGIALSIDDFGTGSSSLNLLENFSTDVLKLDQQFFKGQKNLNRQYIIVENVVTLAKSLSMKTVAEGVERWTQVEFLKSIECEMIQGYLFEKPLPILEFEEKYIH